MKKYIFTLFLISSTVTFAQELDQDFLDSLPEGMQKDLEKQAKGNTESEDPIYRSIETQTKLEKKNLEDLKKRLEDDLALLEERLKEDEDDIRNKDNLDLFGSSFFRTYQSTYMPINEPNLSPSYILDYGDYLRIQFIGEKDETENYKINRDGSINIPNLEPIILKGLTFQDAGNLIKSKIKSSFIGTEAFVTLSNVRDINVLVSGNAFNPGIYTVSGNSNIMHVIGVAGGINEFGSYREINLIRNQEVVETLDIYDVLITGSYKTKTTLKSGDVIFVTPVKKMVAIDGAVKIPARYELNENQKLYDLIDYANGITADADLSNIYLDRILDGKIKSLPIQNVNQFKTIIANDGDSVYIRKHTFRAINIEGAVLKPGRYLMAEGESLDDLIEKSGGFTENAYPFGAVYENKNAFMINAMAKDKLYDEFIDNIITVSQKNPTGNSDLSSIVDLTKNLKNSKPNGRVVIDLLDEGSTESLLLKDGDRITIPEKSDHIYIYGEVNFEGALKFVGSEDLNFYISKSGGLKENANEEAIYVLHPNGDTEQASLTKSLFQNAPSDKMILYPGSVIFVPRAIDNSAATRLAAQAYVSILGNMGIALASLSSINNNN
jgi:protein involved in polysaccharide export with SLBB domain